MSNRYTIEYRTYKDMGAATPPVYTLWDGNGQQISDAVVKTGINKAGSFDFTIYPAHDHYSKMIPRMGFCTVWDNAYTPAKLVFNGQIRRTRRDLYGVKTVECEGDLGLLNDWQLNKAALNQVPDAETIGTYYPGVTAEQAFKLIFGQTVLVTAYVTEQVATSYHIPSGMIGAGTEIPEELYMAIFSSKYSNGVAFSKTASKTTTALKLVKDGSVIIPTLGTCSFDDGLKPFEFPEGPAMESLKKYLKQWPGRIVITYPVDLWHPVFAYTKAAAVTKHVCTQAVAEGVNILDLTINTEPEEPLVTYITPVYRAWYATTNNLRDNGEANAWRQEGAGIEISSLATEYGTRNGSPKAVEVRVDYDKLQSYLESLGVYYHPSRITFPTAYDDWYLITDTQLTTPYTLNDVVLYHMSALNQQLQAWMADPAATDLFASMDEWSIGPADGTTYDIRVIDRNLVDATIEAFEVGDYATYNSTELLVTGKTLDLWHPENNAVELNGGTETLSEYLGKVE